MSTTAQPVAAPASPPVREAIRGVSIIVPTYREAPNIPLLIERLDQVRLRHALDLEVLIMDDDSRDGTDRAVADLGKDWVRLVVRTKNRGLSPAVLDGLALATKPTVLVMDADLSHPPEKVPEMLDALDAGADFVIGSRYVAGASTDQEWGAFRWANSRVATMMARPLTPVQDPMSGFFALRRETYLRARDLNPIGYKIGLELLVKCRCTNAKEVPIHFADRQFGESKLSMKEQARYVRHLRRLFLFRYPELGYFIQFAGVGFWGTIVNLAVFTLAILATAPNWLAIALGIAVSLVSNFWLNRRYTFSHARHGPLVPQFLGFLGACSVGAAVQYATSLGVMHMLPEGFPRQVAVLGGVAAGMLFNYAINRYGVFRKPRQASRHA
jgi:dolichol-phosphate mannosyltransferase